MKPVAFAYHSPESLEEAVGLYAGIEDPVILAGGQSLIPLLNMRLVRPANVIDLHGIPGLQLVKMRDAAVEIGAMVPQHAICTGSQVSTATPLLSFATSFVGQPHTRSRGTIGGSVAFGSNVAEISVALLALGASIRAVGPQGTRTIALGDFFLDYLETDLAPDEILTQIEIPLESSPARWGFSELKFRGCDFPIVMCAVALDTDDDGTCRSARVAVGGGGPVPARLIEFEELLTGRQLDTRDVMRLARDVADLIDPDDDWHVPADYRRHAAVREVERALAAALGQLHSA